MPDEKKESFVPAGPPGVCSKVIADTPSGDAQMKVKQDKIRAEKKKPKKD